ncbi:hypothetical protein B0H13DRAFT_475688 [Mycena leptocephala]|nr:hypothetical protein B0H13DRAFT_475688 [Mycena leptocephala]
MTARSRLRRTLHSFTKAVTNSLFLPRATRIRPMDRPGRQSALDGPKNAPSFHPPSSYRNCRANIRSRRGRRRHAPRAVSHVCRKWRAISLHTPSLWRRISLSPEAEMWRERIYRAKACSLDVQLVPWRTTSSGANVAQLLDIHTVQLCMHLSRHSYADFDPS